MKTFKDFIAERYYQPDEPLPSGKTPYGKAISSYYRQKGEYYRNPKRPAEQSTRITNQIRRAGNEVRRGADNPNFDAKPDKTGKYDISTDSSYRMTVRDTKNDLEMRVRQKDMIAPGNKPVYDIEWYNFGPGGRKNPGQARAVTRNVADMWKNQVAPRIPSNSVLTNFPITNDTSERNTRSKLYSKVAGFGKPGFSGRQYANVGRNPSSRQAARGAQRITPLSGNLDPAWATGSEVNRMDAARAHKPKAMWAAKEKAAGTRRQIAPAKPSRPLLNQAIKNLKTTAPVKAPTLPKPPAVKLPVTPKVPRIKIRGGGRAALAGAALTGAAALISSMQSKKK